ncbi:MAG: hypothetical protein IJU63_05720 [Bacteroidales bacterium]|nr:hypothetical protein [Bacteroidales bacterium]
MNKVIRMALVCAFAGAALLYSGCTKDFSSDIKEIDTDLTALQGQVANLNTSLEQFKTAANNAIEANKTLIAQKADASTVSALQTQVNNLQSVHAADKAALQNAINELKPRVDAVEDDIVSLLSDVAAAQDDITSIQADIEELKAAKTAFDGNVEDLLAQIGALASRITSIVATPALADVIQTYALGANDTTIFSAAFDIRPKEAAESIDKSNVEVILKEGKNRAAINVTVKPTKVEVDAAKGVVNVYAIVPDLPALGAGNELFYSLDFFGKDNADSTYHVMSEFQDATINATPNNVLTLYKLVKNNAEVTAAPTIAKEVPYDAADSQFKPFDGYSIKVKIGDGFLEPADAAALLGFPAAKMAVRDSIGFAAGTPTKGATKIDTAAFNTSIAISNVATAKTKINAMETMTMYYAIGSAVPAAAVTPALVATYKIIPSVKSLGTLAKQTIKWNFVEGNRTVQNVTLYESAPFTPDPAYTGTFDASRATKGNTAVMLTPAAQVIGISGTSTAFVRINNFPMHTEGGTYKVHNMNYTDPSYAPADTLVLDFEVEVTKFPGDTVITMPDSAYKITAIPAPAKTFAVDFIKNAIAPADTVKFYGDLKTSATPIYTAFDGAAAYTVDSVVVFNAKGVREGTVAGVTATKNSLAFPAATLEYNKTYKAYVKHAAFGGITYKYTQNIVVAPADFHLGTSAYVIEGNIVPIEGDSTTTPGVYSIKKAYLSKYLRVVDSNGNLDNTAGLTVDADITAPAAYEDSTLFKYAGGIWGAANTTLGNAVFQPGTSHTVTDGILSSADSLTWNTYVGREIKVKAVLKAGAQRVDSITLTLKTEKPIKAETTGAIAINRTVGQNDTVILAKKMKITGILNPTQNLVNPTTGAIAGTVNYGVVIDADPAATVRGAVSTEAERDMVNNTEYKLIDKDGDGHIDAIVIIGDSANPTVKFKVPVEVGYYLDYNHVATEKVTVEVVATGSY